jgi:X-Pro dipeptidyl-peptidase C-terminal non-catalytic domain
VVSKGLSGALNVFAASSATDTDWTIKLMDVFPDGRAINVSNGILRASSNNSLEKREPIEPGKMYAYTFDTSATSNLSLWCRASNPGRSIQQQFPALRPQSEYRSFAGVGRRDDCGPPGRVSQCELSISIVLPAITAPLKTAANPIK